MKIALVLKSHTPPPRSLLPPPHPLLTRKHLCCPEIDSLLHSMQYICYILTKAWLRKIFFSSRYLITSNSKYSFFFHNLLYWSNYWVNYKKVIPSIDTTKVRRLGDDAVTPLSDFSPVRMGIKQNGFNKTKPTVMTPPPQKKQEWMRKFKLHALVIEFVPFLPQIRMHYFPPAYNQ